MARAAVLLAVATAAALAVGVGAAAGSPAMRVGIFDRDAGAPRAAREDVRGC